MMGGWGTTNDARTAISIHPFFVIIRATLLYPGADFINPGLNFGL
jgi:hypothetical protein